MRNSMFSGGITPTPIGTQLWANNLAAQYCMLKRRLEILLSNSNPKSVAVQIADAKKYIVSMELLLLSYGYSIVGCAAVKISLKKAKVGDKMGGDIFCSDGLWHSIGGGGCPK